MSHPTSSTSPSKPRGKRDPIDALAILAWTFLFLVATDVSLNVLWGRSAADYRKGRGSFLEMYFDYGRSAEGKLRRMVGTRAELDAPIVGAGVLDVRRFDRQPAEAEAGDRMLIAIYGMSFSNLLGTAIESTHHDITIRLISAPGAPANWVYAAYQLDRNRHHASVDILAIMTQNLAMSQSLSGSTMYFDMPYPYTAPQYRVDGDTLQEIAPLIVKTDQLREALHTDRSKWEAFVEQLGEIDPFYDRFMFRQNLLDRSALVRLIRRGYARWRRASLIEQIEMPDGFNLSSCTVRTVQLMLRDFARSARSDGVLPFVYIVNNQGAGDDLYRAVKPALEAYQIPHLSSHTIVPPDDPSLFLPDSHFLPSKNEELAIEAVRLIDEQLQRGSPKTPGAWVLERTARSG